MIKLKCVNKECNYIYEVTQKELEDYPLYHQKCLICGSKLKITQKSLTEIVRKGIYQRAEQYINKWVAEMGWDNTLDLIKSNKNQASYRIYKEILEKRGFKLK